MKPRASSLVCVLLACVTAASAFLPTPPHALRHTLALQPTRIARASISHLLCQGEAGSGSEQRWGRREALAAAVAVGLSTVAAPARADVDEKGSGATAAASVVLGRLAKDGKVKTLGPAGVLGPTDSVAPPWLVGEWDVEMTYKGSMFPVGKSFAEFKQLVAGSMRSPGEAPGSVAQMQLRFLEYKGGAVEDTAGNAQSYYNAFSKSVTIETAKGPRTRSVSWMPILTQRGVYEKVNSAESGGRNDFKLTVKEIAPDLSVVRTCPMEAVTVNRKSQASEDGKQYIQTDLLRIKRLSLGKVKMIETGTGDSEVVNLYRLQDDGSIAGRHRVLVFLVPFPGPAGDLYADSQGRAVAVYDWDFVMRKRA